MSDVSLADDSVVTQNSRAPAATPIVFTGDNGEFRRLVTRGALLELVTAGFYRFWLATHMRRYLWSSTVIGGDALEYVGKARELLFGFFFALAILAPVYLAYLLIGLEAERTRAFASLPLGLFFVAFGQFAIYRARRYRLHKTSWRGLRFGMGGSGFAYMFRAIGWGFLLMLTLGLALPWAEAALERYKMRHTFYGALEGDFVGRGGDFFKRGWWIWAVSLFGPAGLFGYAAPLGEAGGPLLIAGLVIILLAAPGLYAAFRTAQWRWWLEGLRLGDIRVETKLRTGSLLGNYFAFFGVSIGVVLAIGTAVGVVVAMNRNNIVGTNLPIGVLVFVGVAYLATFLAIGVASRIFLTQRVWKIVTSSLAVHGLEAADAVAMRASAAENAIGEGFADSLDVVGF